MQRDKKHRFFKHHEVQSLTSLVKMAKQNTIERQSTIEKQSTLDRDDTTAVGTPIHDLTVRLTNSLKQMHHHLQELLMQTLGPEARHIVAAERARETPFVDHKFETEDHKEAVVIARRLSEVGQSGVELHQLNVYRKLYATMLAELEVARENMVELEQRIEEESIGGRSSIDKKDIKRISKDSSSELSE
jgi:hypothetical protein